MNKCSVPYCENQVKAKRLCGKHYERLRAHGSVYAYNNPQRKTCTVEGCTNLSAWRGFCTMHNARILRHGDTESRLPTYGLGKHIHEQGYVMIKTGKGYKFEHTLLAEKALGKPLPPKAVVHHMNEDPADNHTPFNLVICPDQAYHFLLHRRARGSGPQNSRLTANNCDVEI